METHKAKQQNLAEHRVEVFEHYCKHRQGPEEMCNAQELAKRLSGKDAVVIKGIYDDEHLRLYREAVARAGLNQMLVKVVDYRWDSSVLESTVAALRANWVAELSPKAEETINYTRRDLITGNVKVHYERLNKPVFIAEACGDLYRVCDTCQQSCPKSAIAVDRKAGVSIDYNLCYSCGLCAAACPTGALQMPEYPGSSFAAMGKVKGGKVISCYKHNGESIKVACIAELSPLDVLALRSGGPVTLYCPDKTCPMFGNLSKLQQDVGRLEKVYDGMVLVLGDELKKAEKASDAGLEAPITRKRHEEFKGLLNEQNAAALGVVNVVINNELCTLCENCAKYCPTEALTIRRNQGKTLLAFNPESCIGCRVCADVCPENGAIVLNEFAGKFGERTIAEDEIVRCRVCGAYVGSRRSLLKVKKTLESKGMSVDDEWLERCPQHRFEYSVMHMKDMPFKPRGGK